MKVKQAMHRGVDWIPPDTKLTDLARLMREKDVGAVPIGERDRLIGMVTDRDIVCRGCAEGEAPGALTARDVMTSGVIYCFEDQDIADAIHIMEDKHVRRLPVLNANKRMVGMLAMGDLAHAAPQSLVGEFCRSVATHH